MSRCASKFCEQSIPRIQILNRALEEIPKLCDVSWRGPRQSARRINSSAFIGQHFDHRLFLRHILEKWKQLLESRGAFFIGKIDLGALSHPCLFEGQTAW